MGYDITIVSPTLQFRSLRLLLHERLLAALRRQSGWRCVCSSGRVSTSVCRYIRSAASSGDQRCQRGWLCGAASRDALLVVHFSRAAVSRSGSAARGNSCSWLQLCPRQRHERFSAALLFNSSFNERRCRLLLPIHWSSKFAINLLHIFHALVVSCLLPEKDNLGSQTAGSGYI